MKASCMLALLCTQAGTGFVVRPALQRKYLPVVQKTISQKTISHEYKKILFHSHHISKLYMYNLPPGGGKRNSLKEIAMSVLGLVGIIAFFASPLGGIFFALFNSFLALAFLTPVVLGLGFQIWQFFNTIEGPCPNCGAPLRILKDSSPSLCINCGTVVQSSRDNDSIEAIPTGMGGTDFVDDTDPFMGGWFDQAWGSSRDLSRRDRTVIDVEIEED